MRTLGRGKENFLDSTYYRLCNVINELRKCGVHKSDAELSYKFLNCLRPKWEKFTIHQAQSKEMTETTIHGLYESHNQFQDKVLAKLKRKKRSMVPVVKDPLALMSDRMSKLQTRPNKPVEKSEMVEMAEDVEKEEEDSRATDIKNAIALLSAAFNQKFGKKLATNNQLRYTTVSQKVKPNFRKP